MELINNFKPLLSIFFKPAALLINLSNIKTSYENFFWAQGIEPVAAGSGSKCSNHCVMPPSPILVFLHLLKKLLTFVAVGKLYKTFLPYLVIWDSKKDPLSPFVIICFSYGLLTLRNKRIRVRILAKTKAILPIRGGLIILAHLGQMH